MIFNFEMLYKAYIKCRKNKRNTTNALKFEQNLIENLCNLEISLKTRNYKPSRSIVFLSNSPKLREIFAADFTDRVVHHLIVPHLQKAFEPKFIYDVYNNLENKGIHQAIKRAKQFANRDKNGFYMQLDIKSFFYNIDKDILYEKISRVITNSDILWLTKVIIDNDVTKNYHFKGDIKKLELLPSHKTLFKIDKNKGLPIGNLTSQCFANIYMNDFDNFVKRVLKCKSYIRYVDDFVIFSSSKEELEELKIIIEDYLYFKLKLELRNDTKCKSVKDGLDFLGYIIRPNYILVRNRVVNNYKYKKAKYLEKYESLRGNMSLEEIKKFLSVQNSFVSHIKHANSYTLKQKIGEIDNEKYIDKINTFGFFNT